MKWRKTHSALSSAAMAVKRRIYKCIRDEPAHELHVRQIFTNVLVHYVKTKSKNRRRRNKTKQTIEARLSALTGNGKREKLNSFFFLFIHPTIHAFESAAAAAAAAIRWYAHFLRHCHRQERSFFSVCSGSSSWHTYIHCIFRWHLCVYVCIVWLRLQPAASHRERVSAMSFTLWASYANTFTFAYTRDCWQSTIHYSLQYMFAPLLSF